MVIRASLSLGLTVFLSAILGGNLPFVYSQESPNIPEIGSIGPITRVHTDFQFTEGPASDGRGNLYFSDVAGNKIYRVDADHKLSVFLDPSSHANGLFVDRDGHLIADQMDGRVVRINVETKSVTPLAETYDGKRFNAPNDLAVDREGGIYFTDPRFRAPEPWPQGKEAVYYRSPQGKVERLISDVEAPNGVRLSPDEKTLYVVPSLQKEILAYDVKKAGELGSRRVFASLKQPAETKDTRPGGDGLAVDARGNLYVTSALGLQVFDPAGKYLGVLTFPEQPSNATFGGPHHKTLFVTARKSLYSVELSIEGNRPAGGPASSVVSGSVVEVSHLKTQTSVAKPQIVLDVRTKEKYEAGHLLGAQSITIADWNTAHGKGQDAAGWGQRLGALGITSDIEVLVYDDATGPSAARAWWYLRYWGIQNVSVINGGWKAIEGAHLTTEKVATPAPKPASFVATPSPIRVTDKTELLAVQQAGRLNDKATDRWQVIDARSSEEYRGERPSEGLSRPGTIPGAKHLEYQKLLDAETGRLKSPAELRAVFSQHGIDLSIPTVTISNGGGRSTFLILALEAAGATRVKNYLGGLKEWASDPVAPVVTSSKS